MPAAHYLVNFFPSEYCLDWFLLQLREIKLKKSLLLLVPFFTGLVLMIYSWQLSYPLFTTSVNNFVFDKLSFLYWVSLPLLLVSMFLMALTTKNTVVRWILSIGIVLTIFSLPYFYTIMPTGDSQQFRALVEYFKSTGNLDPSQLNHMYYQWPAFFLLADVVTSISGLAVTSYEFVLFTLIGVVLGSALFIYGSKKYLTGGIVVVAAFFMSIMYFIDYQPVPFTLALVLLFLLFTLDARPKSTGIILTMLILYAGLLLTHLFVPLFFVLYLLARSFFEKNKQNKILYRDFFLVAIVSYFLIQLSLARFSFSQLIVSITQTPVQSLSYFLAATTTNPVDTSINNTAQLFSRFVTLGAVAFCAVGLIILFIKRNTRAVDKAVLLAGAVYSALGAVLNTLGYRALAVAFLPISLGAAFLLRSKFRPYFAVFFSVLLALFVFVPLHNSFSTQVSFQTTQNYCADNFFLNHYNWNSPGTVVSDFWTGTYLAPRLNNYVYIYPTVNQNDKIDAVLYTPQFAGADLANYTTMQSLAKGEGLNVVYNDGVSSILTNSNH